MKVINGKELADKIKTRVRADVNTVRKSGREINFAAVVVGDNPASHIYVNKKKQACAEVGINMQTVMLATSISQDVLRRTLVNLSEDKNIHGILLQLPLPNGLNAREAISCIVPSKDVDGLTPENFGLIMADASRLVPCTAQAVVHILEEIGTQIPGKDICIIGRSNIVGKPTALLLLARDATVTICHSKTKSFTKYTEAADIVITAAGVPNLLKGCMIKQGAVVIDVGVNRLADGKVCGDVEFSSVAERAAFVTPVPGGVGPLTIAFLLSNIVKAFKAGEEKHV